MIYLGGPDVVGHRFWRYYEPAAFRWPDAPDAKASEALARVIPNYYEWMDEMIGALAESAGPDVAVIVCSDHGMHAFSTDAPGERFLSGHHLDAPPGVIVAAGPGIARKGDVQAFLAGADPQRLGSVLSMTPTILALLGIARSGAMPEPPLAEMLDGEALANTELVPVESHDVGFRAPSRVETPEDMNRNFLERFRNLGYIGSDTPEPPPK
jgi:hypothetical protein